MHGRCDTVCYAEAMFGVRAIPKWLKAGRPRGSWW